MKLTEALDKPAPIKWKSKSDIYWDGEFIVGDIKYNIIFKLNVFLFNQFDL